MALLPLIAAAGLLAWLASREKKAAAVPPAVTILDPPAPPAALVAAAAEVGPVVASAGTPAEEAAAAAAVEAASRRDWPVAVAEAVTSNDARTLDTVAAAMKADGLGPQAATVQAVAEMLRTEAQEATAAEGVEATPAELKALEAPVPLPAPNPAQDAARALAVYIPTARRYFEDRAKVAAYQAAMGLVADGKYGPGVATAMVPFGIIPPPPFYWPATGATKLQTQLAALYREQAAKDPQRAAEWLYAAEKVWT